MSRPDTNDGRRASAPTDADYAQVAELATKISALPTQGPHATKDAPCASGVRVLSWPALLLISLAWLVTLVIGLIATLQVFYHDGTHLLVCINAFTRYVYLPSYACLVVALWKRRRWLALANLAIVSCHLFWIAPDFMRDRRFDPAPNAVAAQGQPAKTVRIFFANVRIENGERGSLLRDIRDANPDVVVLVEFSKGWRNAFLHSPLMATFPYGSGLDPAQAQGDSVNIFSKLPLKSDTREWITDRCIESVEIPLGSQTLRLVGLHAPRPMDSHNNDYNGYWSRVVPLLLGMRGFLVVVGDCNATQYSHVYEQLKAGGLRSAHEDRGRGYATTWPNGQFWLPPIRIDQAFLSPDVSCEGISEGRGLGSDHKPLILDVQIPDRP